MSMENDFELDFPGDDDSKELNRQESAAYHTMSLARTEYEEAHAAYIRISDRLNDLKLRDSREPK